MHQTYTAALSKGEFDSDMSQKSQRVNRGVYFKSQYLWDTFCGVSSIA